ncbi:MAG: GHMP kinase, partial [Candidatus Kerfeldbacteria bacterium]|nr:GHMP kinase [Candidatus Kerfeldbacteria bacterium]
MIISKTPMRMSFVGGGSDLEAYWRYGRGAVVSAAVDKFIYITVNQKFTNHIRVGYSITEHVERVEDIKHNLVRESLRLTGVTQGVDVVYMSDMLPDHEGSGLGASSSIVVGTLHALHAHRGEH